ncbi:MAG: hypothetical protein HUU20_01715 [Pirellulales bacterium]|nr:hypothetical protein [Pirellulales bacterium]
MLTPKEQAVRILRQRGWSCAQIAEHLGISRNAEKFRAWCGRRRIAKGDPLILPGSYCVFRFGPYTGVLPSRLLPDWMDRVWTARQGITWLAGLDRQPETENLLGAVPLTANEASTVRRLLAGTRAPGVYKIDCHSGKVTFYSGLRTAGRAEGVSAAAIHNLRQRGHGRGCYWL